MKVLRHMFGNPLEIVICIDYLHKFKLLALIEDYFHLFCFIM